MKLKNHAETSVTVVRILQVVKFLQYVSNVTNQVIPLRLAVADKRYLEINKNSTEVVDLIRTPLITNPEAIVTLVRRVCLTYSVTHAIILVILQGTVNIRVPQTRKVRQEKAPACRTESNKFQGLQDKR